VDLRPDREVGRELDDEEGRGGHLFIPRRVLGAVVVLPPYRVVLLGSDLDL
jgi:hypothetical protein